VELGWPLPKRKQFLKDLTAQKTDRTHPVRFQGKNQYLPVHVVPLGLPLYRLENGRTTGRQAEYLADHPQVGSNFFRVDGESVEAQKIQHEILTKLTRERKNLFREFETEPQADPIILTANGYVVNGNRRLSTWRALYASNPAKFSRFKNVDAVILPYADDRDIDQVEADYQLKEDLKADYSWTSTALMIREKMERYRYTQEDLAAIYGKDKKQIMEILDCLDYADQYLESRNSISKYTDVDDKEYAFIQIYRSRKRLKGSNTEREIFERAAFCLADEAGEGKRIYSEIPKIADHLGNIVESLGREFDLDTAKLSSEAVAEKIAGTLNEEENYERARLVIRDAIEAVSQHKKHKKKKEYVSLLVTKARDNLKEAKSAIDGQSSRDGVNATLLEVTELTRALQAWAAGDAK
jgi:hypothetical protein